VLWSIVVVHAVLVVPVVVIWLVAAEPSLRSSLDANIGAGLLGLYLMAFGFPWSLSALFVDLSELSRGWLNVVVTVPPLLNLLIVFAAVRAYLRRRS
jgi:hypothetical protein